MLAGDHKQLPPTIISDAAARAGLDATLFERAHALLGQGAAAMLTTQSRMHSDVCGWASGEMYDGRLVPAASVAAHTLADLVADRGNAAAAEAMAADECFGPLLFIDTAGCGCVEAKADGGGGRGGDSTRNEREAAAVMAHVRRLLAAGLRPTDVGVITPYAAQVACLRELRGPDIADVEISTVDGFQGREKEAIIISAVRSNDNAAVGFLADARRMNVAVTRGRRHVALIGDSDTLGGGDAFLKRLVDWFEAHGAYDTAEVLLD